MRFAPILCAVLLFTSQAFAQERTAPDEAMVETPPAAPSPPPRPWIAPKHMIDLNPAALLNGELSLEYEGALGSHVSLLLGPDAVLYRGVGSPLPPDAVARGGSLKIGLHIFPWGNALNGFWIGPELIGVYAGVSSPEGKGSVVGFEADGSLGYTFIVADHLGISLGLGAGYRILSLTTQAADGTTNGALTKGLALTGRLAVGYAF